MIIWKPIKNNKLNFFNNNKNNMKKLKNKNIKLLVYGDLRFIYAIEFYFKIIVINFLNIKNKKKLK